MSRYWDIYEKELKNLGHGLPVWQAEPFASKDEVHVGDVGYMDKGRFRRVFNVFYGDTRPNSSRGAEEDEDNTTTTSQPPASFKPGTWESGFPNCYGVPANHIPWVMSEHEFGLHGYLYRGTHAGSHCTVTEARPRAGIDPVSSVPGLELGASVSFTSERQRGAALILRTDAESREVPEDLFRRISGPLWESWREFTSTCDAHHLHGDRVKLVYGHTKAGAWTAIAAEHNQRSGKLAFDIDLPAIGSGGLDFRREEITTVTPYTNHGPRAFRLQTEGRGDRSTSSATASSQLRDLKMNQTVFIRRISGGGKSSLRKLKDLFALKAGRQEQSTAAGSGLAHKANEKQSQSPLSRFRPEKRGSADSGTNSDSVFSSTVVDDDLSSTEFEMDPLDELLLHVLEAEEDAECAVVSDNDIDALFNQFTVVCDDRPEPEDMTELIKVLKPATLTDDSGIARVVIWQVRSQAVPAHSQAVPAHSQAVPAHVRALPRLIPGTSTIVPGPLVIGYPLEEKKTRLLQFPENPQQLTIADARKSYWLKMLKKSSTFLRPSESRVMTAYRTKLTSLQTQLSVMLHEAERFLDILSREDIFLIGEEENAVLFFDHTALTAIAVDKYLLSASLPPSVKVINAISQTIGTLQSAYTMARHQSPSNTRRQYFLQLLKMIPESVLISHRLGDLMPDDVHKSRRMQPINDILKEQTNFDDPEVNDLIQLREEARIPFENL